MNLLLISVEREHERVSWGRGRDRHRRTWAVSRSHWVGGGAQVKGTKHLLIDHTLSIFVLKFKVSQNIFNLRPPLYAVGIRDSRTLSRHKYYFVCSSIRPSVCFSICPIWRSARLALIAPGCTCLVSWLFFFILPTFLPLIIILSEIPYEPSCPSVGRLVALSVCHNFLKGQEVTLPCFYRHTY